MRGAPEIRRNGQCAGSGFRSRPRAEPGFDGLRCYGNLSVRHRASTCGSWLLAWSRSGRSAALLEIAPMRRALAQQGFAQLRTATFVRMRWLAHPLGAVTRTAYSRPPPWTGWRSGRRSADARGLPTHEPLVEGNDATQHYFRIRPRGSRSAPATRLRWPTRRRSGSNGDCRSHECDTRSHVSSKRRRFGG
jgi:hypothetical protein